MKNNGNSRDKIKKKPFTWKSDVKSKLSASLRLCWTSASRHDYNMFSYVQFDLAGIKHISHVINETVLTCFAAGERTRGLR